MAVYHAIGKAFVTDSELMARGGLESASGPLAQPADAADLLTTVPDIASGNEVGFNPIGLGKPLIIEVRHVYTGDRTKKPKDLMVTTALKNAATFDAAPRAINFLMKKVAPRTGVSTPSASGKGTPLVFYSPALVQESSLLTVEFGFDEFPDEAFGFASQTFQDAAGIPMFASISPYLVAAGVVTRLVGKLASKFFDRPAVFELTDRLSFETAGMKPPQADYRLLLEDGGDPGILVNHRLSPQGVLVDGNGKPYAGEQPYVVISLDGRERESLQGFSPTAASAALLQRFYKISEGGEQPLEPLIDALKLYSDLQFHEKAVKIDQQLAGLAPGDPKKAELEKKRKALVDNILNGALKPK